ncbi:peptide deformylase [Helicobacter cetorum]|uniref:Peptide deformylase n=1 Tax=Helicobacter cetorum (strain ATCC BAA-540 / CCUG 52418 / MIT 99-5656) TaxID=1163745 RepID=I0ET53_HELCM|nr:peptide deformylase [Helicobacter cetorum]AFI06122.1 peptide deformylase [Helicobacter cetorum MIT 99-5656]
MALLEIVHYPSKILRSISKEVVSFDTRLHQQLEDMYETMIVGEGIGLAAIQVGLPLRMLLINIPREDNLQYKEDCLEIINPKLVETKGVVMYKEGCLSVPEFYEEVERFEKIKIEYQNRFAEVKVLEASGLLAVAIQHEIDHLNGVLFVDKLSILKRKKFEKELKKKQKHK